MTVVDSDTGLLVFLDSDVERDEVLELETDLEISSDPFVSHRRPARTKSEQTRGLTDVDP